MNRNLLYSTRTILTLALVLFTLLSYSQSPKTYSSSGTFTVPAGVTTVTAQAWGGGGKGGTRTSNGQAGGGGGGAYALEAVTVSASNPPYTVTVGSGSTTTSPGGDSWFSTSGTVLAKGGLSVPNNDINGFSGGLATSSIGSTTLKGGNGANGSATVLVGGGGGGGSSAGSALVGVNGNGTAGGAAPAGGGNGGNGKLITSQGDGLAGVVPGGGGGGAYRTSNTRNGGNGADGQVILSWTCPTYSLTNTSIVSPLCTPNSASVTLTGSAAGLPIGTYTVSYTLSGSNTGSNTATMTVSTAGTGNFSTIALNNAGITTVTINNLSSGVAPDNCSTNITSSNSANVTVNATPAITSTTPGSRTGIGTVVLGATASVGTISWYANATGGTALGMGTSFTTPGLITTTTFYVEVVNGTCILSPRTAVVATVNFSEISVSGNGLNIADEDTTPIVTDYTNLGTANLGFNISRTYTIQNSGTIDLTIGTITISGVNASEFVVTTPPSATVIPGGSTTFTIRFTPLLAGSRNANVSFVTNDADENPFNFDIAGTGGTGVIPEINVQGLGVTIIDGDSGPTGTDGTDFGSLIIPSAVTRTFTIQNTGTGPLVLSGTPIVLLSGSTNFIVSTQPSSNTIAAGSSLSFQIKFEPTETGSSVALVSINNDDSDESIYDFAITGSAVVTGKEIDIQGNEISIVDGDLTPSVLDQTDFGITDSSTPIPLTYNIYSFGSNTLTLNTTISITGTNASLFSVTTIPSTLNAGAVTSFVITFTPTSSLGVKTATVTITSDDPNEGTYNFDLKAEVQTLPPLTIAPGGITSNLKFWLKADSNIGTIADNTAISSWPDQTHGNTKNAISKFAKEPKFQNNPSYNVNFNPVIHFNGNNWMSGGQGFNNSDMFIVVKPTSQVSYTSSAQDIYSGDDTGTNKGSQDVTGFQMGNTSSRHSNDVLAYNQGANTSFGIAENSTTKNYTSVNIFNPRKNATYPTVKMDILNNGNTLSTSSVFTGTYKDIVNTRYWLGRSEFFDASYDGDILEVINYNIRNSDADKSKIETYLAIKYGITLGVNGVSQNYINSAGTTIYAAGSGFNYNIAGIGRDDKSLLNQKQSKTENTNSDITIGLGDIFDKNSSNTNTFNDKDFLVWGNNNNTLTAQSPIVVDMSTGTIPALSTEVDFISIGRTWKVIETGINVPSVKVSIPSVMLTATITPPGDFLMFISDSPVFNPTAEYRIMNTNGSNLEANYDFNGTKYITFGYAPERTFIRAIDFDGVNDYLDAGKVLDLNTNFTVSAWVKRSSNNQTILSKRNNPFSIGYDLSINSSQKAEMSWFNGTKQTITSSVILPLEKWHHIGVIFDGTTAKLYIDGVLDVSKAMATVPANTQSFLIAAADGESPTSFFNGTIDEVRVWNVALTDKELRYVMNQEISRNSTFTSGAIVPNNITLNEIGSIPWANLSAYYPMSTYTFTNAKDISSNNHTAAIKNLTTVDWQTAPLPYESLADGDWQTTTTWKNNAVQDIPYSLSIIDNITRIDWNIVQTNHTITSTGNKTILGLFVNSNTLSATNDSKIEISHYLKLDGKIDLVGRSQLVQKLGSDLDPTSSGSLERDQLGQANKYNYNYWSSPVGAINATTNNNSFTVAGVLRDGTNPAAPATINWVNGYNGSSTTPISLARFWIYKFDNLGNNYANWTQIGETGTLSASKGFTLKGPGASGTQNLTFLGKPNNGTINNTVGADQLLLIGNPYPSALDADKFINDNIGSIETANTNPAIDGALYFWEHYATNSSHDLAAYQGGYGIRNLSGGVAPSATGVDFISGSGTSSKSFPKRYIPVGQGFFVIGKASTGGTVTFNNSQRDFITESNAHSQETYRIPVNPKASSHWTDNSNAVIENDTHKKISLGFNVMDKTFHRQVLLAFMDEKANSEMNDGYDAFNIDDSPSDMYLLNGENELAIQGEGYFDEDASFPIAVRTEATGKVSFGIDALENFDQSQNVFIYDKETDSYNSIKNKLYEVELSEGYFKDRFSLRFTDKTLGVKDVIYENSIQVAFTRSNNVLNITNGAIDNTVVAVSLFNIQGKLMSTWDVSEKEQTSIKIPIQNKTSGVYIVKLKTLKGNINKKIIIK